MRPLPLIAAGVALLQLSPTARPQPRDPDFDTTRTADRRGEKLPPGVVARLGGRGPGGSLGASFSPDGRRVAFVGPERDTHVWDVRTETELHRLPHDNPANFPTNNDRRIFSADGQLLFGDGGAVWDVTSGKRVARFGPFPRGGESPLAYPTTSPDGKTLAYATTQHGSFGAEVVLYDIASRRELRRFGKDTRVQGPLAFSPDGRTLAAGKCFWELPEALGWRGLRPRPPRPPEDYGGVLLFDTATGAKTAEVFSKGFYGWTPVGFSPSGATLYLLDRQSITPFDVATRTPGEPFGRGLGMGAVLLRDGRAIAAPYAGGALTVWGTDGKEIARFDQPGTVCDVALSPGGRWVATTSSDGPVLVWDVAALRAGKRPLP